MFARCVAACATTILLAGCESLYSVGAFDTLFRKFSGERRLLWNNYPGVQAWQVENRGCGDVSVKKRRWWRRP